MDDYLDYRKYVTRETRVDPRSLGGVIRAARERKGWSQVELANRMGIQQTVVSKVEVGKTNMPNPETLLHFAAALDIPAGKLLSWARWPEAIIMDEALGAAVAQTPIALQQAATPLFRLLAGMETPDSLTQAERDQIESVIVAVEELLGGEPETGTLQDSLDLALATLNVSTVSPKQLEIMREFLAEVEGAVRDTNCAQSA